MKEPGPDHPITIEPTRGHVRVTFGGKIIADTMRALTLTEATYPPVQYIPRADVAMSVLTKTQHRTSCPYKGDASYFSINTGDAAAENAVWSYEQPYPAMSKIAGYLAFYPNKVVITRTQR